MSTVYETTDYSQFKRIHGNREIFSHCLLESVKKKNMLKDHPIIVAEDKEWRGKKRYVIVDGQHRHEVAKSLKVPLYYIITENFEKKDIPLCQTQRPWQLEDYLIFHKPDMDDYEFVYQCSKEFNLRPHFIVEVTYHNTKGCFKAFRSGEFSISKDRNEIKRKFSLLCDIRDFCEPVLKSKFTKAALMATWRLINRPDYIHAHFLQKLDVFRENFTNAYRWHSTREIYEHIVSDVYNWMIKDEKKKLKIEEVQLKLVNFKKSVLQPRYLQESFL
jgi:hypothetical protein